LSKKGGNPLHGGTDFPQNPSRHARVLGHLEAIILLLVRHLARQPQANSHEGPLIKCPLMVINGLPGTPGEILATQSRMYLKLVFGPKIAMRRGFKYMRLWGQFGLPGVLMRTLLSWKSVVV
jgi:hypothetical protein